MSEQPQHDLRAISAFLVSAFNDEELKELIP